MRVERRISSPTTEFLPDKIKSIEEYSDIVNERIDGNSEIDMVCQMAELTMSKKVLKQYLISYINLEGFPYATVARMQNVSKIIGTPEFDRFVEGLIETRSSFAYTLITRQKWRANQLKDVLTNYDLLDLAVQEVRFPEFLGTVMTNNRIPYEEIIGYIEQAEEHRPSYFNSNHSFRGAAYPYERLGGTLLETYEVPRDYILSRIEMFNDRTFHATRSFDQENFIAKGFSFSEILNLHGGRFSDIRVKFFADWLKSEERTMEGIDITRVRVYLETIKDGRIDSEESLITLLVELNRERNSALAVTESFLTKMLDKVSLVPMAWSDAMLSIPKKLANGIYESINSNQYDPSIMIGKTQPSMSEVFNRINEKRNTGSVNSDEIRIVASYETLREWQKQDEEQFKKMSDYVSLKNDGGHFFRSVKYTNDFLTFMSEHFKRELDSMSSSAWARIFKDNKIEDSDAFNMAIVSLRRDRDKNSSLFYQSNARDIFANMHGKIDLEIIKEFADFLNFAYDIRAFDSGIDSIFEKGEF